MARGLGSVLLVLGLLLLGLWGYYQFLWDAPLEEPALPGRTPDPSRTPWTFDPGEMDRVYREARLTRLALSYGLPGAGAAMVLVGAFLLASGPGPKLPPR